MLNEQMSRSACQEQTENGKCEGVRGATLCLSCKNDYYFILVILVPGHFRIKCPPRARKEQALPTGLGTMHLPPTLPLSRSKSQLSYFDPSSQIDLTFLGSSRHLSGDQDPCAHLVAQITSPLEHLRAVSLGQSPRIPEHLICVPGNKSHSSYFHNLTQDEVKECPGMPGKGVWNCGTIGHRGIGGPKRLETVLQQIFPDHSH